MDEGGDRAPADHPAAAYDVIIPAGGTGTRLGGIDKPGIEIRGLPMLDHVLAAVGAAATIVCVGPARATTRPVIWCREDPPGGGPAAALAAGMAVLAGRAPNAALVLVLAADLPGVAPAVPALLGSLTRDPRAEAAVLTDASGRTNYLAAAWRSSALMAVIEALGDPGGVPMGALVRSARTIAVTDEDGWGRDCDTWDDIAAARVGPPPG